VVGFGAYALTHRDSFDWGQAALWTGGGALVGATLGVGAKWVTGALGTKAAVATTTAAAGAAESTARLRPDHVVIDWLASDPNRVKHIMQAKHAWERLVTLTGDVHRDYQTIQPYLYEVMSTHGTVMRETAQGHMVTRFVKTVGGQEIVVTALRIGESIFQIVDAWVKTR
jgi:hypothetical protein